MLKLDLSAVDDKKVRDNLEEIEKEVKKNPISSGTWQFFEKEFETTGTFKIFHKLGFVPKDVLQTYSFGAGTITYDYSSFTKEYVQVTIGGGSITVRFMAGKVGT